MTTAKYPLTVLAIDPGPTKSTLVRCRFTGVRNILEEPIVITEAGEFENMEMLERLGAGDDVAVCEMIACYGMAVGKEVFDTCRWIGRYEQRFSDARQNMHLLTRLTVKMAICNSQKAKDANMRQALIDRYGAPGTKKAPGALYGISSHAWAALAVAVAWHDYNMPTGIVTASAASAHGSN